MDKYHLFHLNRMVDYLTVQALSERTGIDPETIVDLATKHYVSFFHPLVVENQTYFPPETEDLLIYITGLQQLDYSKKAIQRKLKDFAAILYKVSKEPN